MSAAHLFQPSNFSGESHVQNASTPEGEPRTPLWSTAQEVFKLLSLPLPDCILSGNLRFQHLHFRSGQRIHLVGQEFDSLYVVNSGFLKTAAIDEFGNEQVIGFPMKGDILGTECICSRRFPSEAVALTDCNLIVVPYQILIALGHEHIEIQNAMIDLLSRELNQSQTMINLLGKPNAETRVARFLVYLAERYEKMGYSRTMFNLQMTRQEIGSYLGLSLETVSRALSALSNVELISVDQRAIWIREPEILKAMRRIPRSRVRTEASRRPPTPRTLVPAMSFNA